MPSGFVGILTFDLHMPDGASLKGKRRHLLHTKAQLERRFGASVAEVDLHDLWQRSRLTMAVVRRDHSAARQALDDAERYLSAQEYELVACTRTVMSPEDEL
jgi:uncharacterized protein